MRERLSVLPAPTTWFRQQSLPAWGAIALALTYGIVSPYAAHFEAKRQSALQQWAHLAEEIRRPGGLPRGRRALRLGGELRPHGGGEQEQAEEWAWRGAHESASSRTASSGVADDRKNKRLRDQYECRGADTRWQGTVAWSSPCVSWPAG